MVSVPLTFFIGKIVVGQTANQIGYEIDGLGALLSFT